MTEETATNLDELSPEDEFEALKARAKTLGINVGNSSLETLRKRVKDALAPEPEESEAQPLTKRQREQMLRKKIQEEQLALVRCRIYNLNPSKRDLQGEIITVGNKYLGTVRKFIPFGEATENGYHIPRCIYNDLKARKYQEIRNRKVKGIDHMETRMVPEYNIEILPPLTEKELKELALRQEAAARLGGGEGD